MRESNRPSNPEIRDEISESRVDMASQNLFPSIGTVAQQADDSADPISVNDENRTCPKEDEDQVVQEVESLCMNCEEQVGT